MQVIKVILWVFVFGCLGFSENAQGKAEEMIIGLVEIPGLFGTANPNGPPGQNPPKKIKPIELRAEPNEKAKVTARLTTPADVVSREHEYEENSAVVLERKGQWYLIRYLIKSKSANAWLSPKDAGPFRSIEELIKGGLVYLTRNWDGRLYQSPDSKKNFLLIKAKEEDVGDYANWQISRSGVKILGSKQIAGQLWFHVQLDPGQCQPGGKHGETGWVPAHNENREPNLWFFSRGC